MATISQNIIVQGMHCAGCESTIENAINKLPGISNVKADYEHDLVNVNFDDQAISIAAISSIIEKAGYQAVFQYKDGENISPPIKNSHGITKRTLPSFLRKLAAICLALSGIGIILWLDTWFMNHADMPKLSRDISHGLLFLIGFLTSFHCVGMCGPLILGYTANNAARKQQSHIPHVLYGIGKTLSYSLIGAVFGAFGSFVAFTPKTQGVVGIAAGVFLILYGLHMLELFAFLRHFQLKIPAGWTRLLGKEYRKHSNPFIIGLMNGLMIICGPLQAMYVMAAGTGDWLQGASILFFFGLGTLPLLMGFGMLTSLLSANLTPKLLKASGYIVMALGAIMLNRGLAVTGMGFDLNTLVAKVSQELSPQMAVPPSDNNLQIITMDVMQSGYSPNKFTLRKGVPVKWIINGKEINECNKSIVVPQYKLTIDLHAGLQTVEFLPQEAGVVPWSCWMGMIPGTFIVVEDHVDRGDGKSAILQDKETQKAKPNQNEPNWQRKLQRWWQQLLTDLHAV